MPAIKDRTVGERMRAELGRFISKNLNNPSVGWPRLATHTPMAQANSARTGCSSKLKVLIIGDLFLEMPVYVNATRAEIISAMARQDSDARFRWRMGRLRVGGFVAGCAPAVASLGAEIELAAVLPAPLPVQIVRFLDTYNIGYRNIASLPRSRSAKMSIHCSDGTLTLPTNCTAPTPQRDWRKRNSSAICNGCVTLIPTHG